MSTRPLSPTGDPACLRAHGTFGSARYCSAKAMTDLQGFQPTACKHFVGRGFKAMRLLIGWSVHSLPASAGRIFGSWHVNRSQFGAMLFLATAACGVHGALAQSVGVPVPASPGLPVGIAGQSALPTPPAAAPSSKAPAAMPPARLQTRQRAAITSWRTRAGAAAACGKGQVVWGDPHARTAFASDAREFGHTSGGAYMCRQHAVAMGYGS